MPSSASRFQAKKIVENALLSKLQEAQGQVEEKQAALALSEERAACLQTEKARQEAAVSALTKQLQDANKCVAMKRDRSFYGVAGSGRVELQGDIMLNPMIICKCCWCCKRSWWKAACRITRKPLFSLSSKLLLSLRTLCDGAPFVTFLGVLDSRPELTCNRILAS